MEAITPTRARSFGIPLRLLVRQPQLWAALAAFVGAALGLAGAFRLAAWLGDPHGSLHSLSLLALLVAPLGELLVALSLLGVLPLLGGAAGVAARAARILGVLLVYLFLLVFMATLAIELGWIQLGDDAATSGRPPSLLAALLVLGICLPPLVVAPFALAAFLSRRARLGAVLLGLCALAVPSLIVWQMVSGGIVGAIPSDAAPAVLLGGLGAGVSLLEAPLWVLFGSMLVRGALSQARARAERSWSEGDLASACRLYEEGLGAGDFSVVDELASGDFRDPKSGARGRPGMERVFADLWASYPDLSVSVEGQEAEGDVVRTRLAISRTDRGWGVMWYPPTGRRVSFSAEFADRFEHGLLWWSSRGRRTPRTSCGNSGTAGRFERLATRTTER